VKVVISGETFEWDGTKAPMSEALAIEHVYKRRYAEWQSDLQAGSAKAMCVLAWLIWRRDGRDVPFEDILGGTIDFDLNEMLTSLAESAEAGAEPDPTPSPAPAGTDGTATATSGSSPSGSGSNRGKSTKSSASGTSRRS
jgi:hypothetical protein